MKCYILVLVLGLVSLVKGFTGPEIIEKVNELMNQETSQSTMEMTIFTSGGQKRTFEYLSYSANYGEKNLIIYQAPARVKGQRMLMLNHADDIWAYFPRTRRVRKLATHAKKQKFEGSDFSNQDIGSGDSFITDYNPTLLGEEKKQKKQCYKVEMQRVESADISYSKLIMWVDKQSFVPLVIDYYDDKIEDRILKTLILSDIQTIDNIPTATRMEMINHGDNTSTTITLTEIQYNIALDDDLFTERGLKK